MSASIDDNDSRHAVASGDAGRGAAADELDADDGAIDVNEKVVMSAGRLQDLKKKEKELLELIKMLRMEKVKELNKKELVIGVVGFGNFGQFIAKTLSGHAKIVAMSRSDYSVQAEAMGGCYVPLSKPEAFFRQVDVVLFMVSIKSFKGTLENLMPAIVADQERRKTLGFSGPLFADVLSVKEHPRKVMLEMLPEKCDVVCTHPMFGPVSGKNGWTNLKFIFEKTRVDGKVLPLPGTTDMAGRRKARMAGIAKHARGMIGGGVDGSRNTKDDTTAAKEGFDRMERFLSIWEEEGCTMEEMSCKDHDLYAARSQFITHLVGRTLGTCKLQPTPVDTMGFESMLALDKSVNADSFDLFYGLYKYNNYNAMDIIFGLRKGISDVLEDLRKIDHQQFDAEARA